jgi:HEAT repeat protein
MRWLNFILVTVCFCSARASLVFGQEKSPYPVTLVAGRTLEYWISQIPSKDQSKSENAIRAVMEFGPDRAYQAVPVVLDRVRQHAGKQVDVSVRVNGAIALGYILGGYKGAEHKVVKDAVSVLRRYMADSQTIVRFRAVQALGLIGTEAKDTIPEIINLVKDPSTYETRQAASIALGQVALDDVHGPSVAVLNALYGALADGSVQVRLAAIQSLTRLGGPTNAALRQRLLQSLNPVAYKDSEPTVRIWAHMAVMSITRTVYKDRVDMIAQMVGDPDLPTRAQAIQALGSIGKEAKSSIPVLMKALHDPEPTVVGWAIWALGRIGPSANVALAELERYQADASQPEAIRNLANEAVREIKGKKK